MQSTDYQRGSRKALAATLAVLRDRFADRLTENATIRAQHSNMLSRVPSEPPDFVIYQQTTAEVATIVKICAAYCVPVIPFGTGTSFEGHFNASFGGRSIDASQMKRIIAVNAGNGPQWRLLGSNMLPWSSCAALAGDAQ